MRGEFLDAGRLHVAARQLAATLRPLAATGPWWQRASHLAQLERDAHVLERGISSRGGGRSSRRSGTASGGVAARQLPPDLERDHQCPERSAARLLSPAAAASAGGRPWTSPHRATGARADRVQRCPARCRAPARIPAGVPIRRAAHDRRTVGIAQHRQSRTGLAPGRSVEGLLDARAAVARADAYLAAFEGSTSRANSVIEEHLPLPFLVRLLQRIREFGPQAAGVRAVLEASPRKACHRKTRSATRGSALRPIRCRWRMPLRACASARRRIGAGSSRA